MCVCVRMHVCVCVWVCEVGVNITAGGRYIWVDIVNILQCLKVAIICI